MDQVTRLVEKGNVIFPWARGMWTRFLILEYLSEEACFVYILKNRGLVTASHWYIVTFQTNKLKRKLVNLFKIQLSRSNDFYIFARRCL